ncbi:MAG: hypothetical protein NZM25_03100 [Leptospiraceae bacterium]|nr:hypothetical protein [Leptospiraceae bacterium]MDW8307257.1 hypothetical protein [Leptospiraceae bacterium]
MKLHAFLTWVLLFSFLLYAQDAKKEEKVLAGGSVYDERFEVNNLFYRKKYAPSGRGEVLELSFDIENKVEYSIPLKLFIVGFYEKDLVDPQYRQRVEYPKWRERDFEKEKFEIVQFDSLPRLNQEEVSKWAAKNRGEELTETKSESDKKKRKYSYQKFLDYISYIEAHPEMGIDVPLQGWENSTTISKKEANYNIVSSALKTSVWAQLYARYRHDRKFFNHLGIILYDNEDKKIAYRQFLKFNRPFRIR